MQNLTDRDVSPLFVCPLENSFKNCIMTADVGHCYFDAHVSHTAYRESVRLENMHYLHGVQTINIDFKNFILEMYSYIHSFSKFLSKATYLWKKWFNGVLEPGFLAQF